MNFFKETFLDPQCAFGKHETDVFEKSWDGERSVGKLNYAILWRSPEPFRTVLGSIGFESGTVPEPF